MAVRYAIGPLSQFILIVHLGDRRAPVHNLHIRLAPQDTMLSYIDGLKQPLVQIAVIYPAKKRLLIRCLILLELIQTVFLEAA